MSELTLKAFVRALAAASVAAGAASAATYQAPRPNGVDDTAALQAAVQKCMPGGADCTVQLAEGVYRTRQVYAYGFHGSLLGRGQGKTIIEPLPGLVVDHDFFTEAKGFGTARPGPDNACPCVLAFGDDSELHLADLSMRISNPIPVAGRYYYSGLEIDWLKAIVLVQGSALIERVSFAGVPKPVDDDSLTDRSADNGPMLAGSRGGYFTLRESRMSNLGNGFEVGASTGLDVRIHDNVSDQRAGGGLFYDLRGSSVDYSGNSADSSIAEWVSLALYDFGDFEDVQGGTTRFEVHDNRFRTGDPTMVAVDAVDQGTSGMSVLIADNLVEVAAGGFGIRTNASGAVIADNSVRGTGVFGITANSASGVIIEDNDVSKFTASVARVRFGAFASGCTAKVRSLSDVLDQGTGNTIIVDD